MLKIHIRLVTSPCLRYILHYYISQQKKAFIGSSGEERWWLQPLVYSLCGGSEDVAVFCVGSTITLVPVTIAHIFHKLVTILWRFKTAPKGILN